MPTTNGPPAHSREQRVLAELHALAPPGERRVVVSINDLAARVGMLPGEASRAMIKLWLDGRVRGYQEPRGADSSVFELVGDNPKTKPEPDMPEPAQPALLSVSGDTNTTAESASLPAPDGRPASAPDGGRGEPKEGGRGEVPDDATLTDGDANDDATFDANVVDFRSNDSTLNVNDGNDVANDHSNVATLHDDGDDHVGGVAVGGGSRGEEPARTAPTSAPQANGLQHITTMFPDPGALAAPRRGTDPTRDLAQECASALHDTENLRAYLKLANHYPEARLRNALATVLAIPEGQVARPGALFTHLVKHGA